MTPTSSTEAVRSGPVRRTAIAVAVVVAAAAGLAACAAVALSPVGSFLGSVLMLSGLAAIVWDAASSLVRAVGGRMRS